ncbi:MAG TPA: hypothetical protein VHK69_03305, partial [Chitinophagaceae bacterium]|nr:hypothetical protein [Chitinophagaceae bacterium]
MATLILAMLFHSCATIPVSDAAYVHEFRDSPPTDKRQFILLKDSSLLYGTKVTGWPMGPIGKRVAKIDGKEIPVADVLAFQIEKGY